ncbi:MAG: sulfate ABC transporter permease subunit CysT [Thermoguttaceae bacterium]
MFVQRSVIPGFGLTMGVTVVYLGLVVLIPLASLFVCVSGMDWAFFWKTVASPRAMASFRLTFGASFAAAAINVVFGFIVAWVLVRYRFYGRRLLDAMVDLPFALPTAVSGIALAELYSSRGWIGSCLPFEVNGTAIGVLVALTFIGLPFAVRTIQPALEEVERELEEVSASLGATRWQTFWLVIFPSVRPAVFTGFAMAFARALGEYGSVIFIAGLMPFKTEIISQLIAIRLGEDNGTLPAAALALVMLIASFALLLIINLLQLWSQRDLVNAK